MRRIGGIVAILLILGLAAVGLIYAQKNIAASSSAVASGSTANRTHSPQRRCRTAHQSIP